MMKRRIGTRTRYREKRRVISGVHIAIGSSKRDEWEQPRQGRNTRGIRPKPGPYSH